MSVAIAVDVGVAFAGSVRPGLTSADGVQRLPKLWPRLEARL